MYETEVNTTALHGFGNVFHIHFVGEVAEHRFVRGHVPVLAHVHAVALGAEAAYRIFRRLPTGGENGIRRGGMCFAIVSRPRNPPARMAPQHQSVLFGGEVIFHDVEHFGEGVGICRIEVLFPLLHQFRRAISPSNFVESGCSRVVDVKQHPFPVVEIGCAIHHFGAVLQKILTVAERVLRGHIDQHRLFLRRLRYRFVSRRVASCEGQADADQPECVEEKRAKSVHE